MRQTSIDAYNRLYADGRLSLRRWQCYECLYVHGPLTGQEIAQKTGIPGMWKRPSELKTLGIVVEAGERTCSVTGETAIQWDVTDYVPGDADYAKIKAEPLREFWAVKKEGQYGHIYTYKKQALTEFNDRKKTEPGIELIQVVEKRRKKPKAAVVKRESADPTP